MKKKKRKLCGSNGDDFTIRYVHIVAAAKSWADSTGIPQSLGKNGCST